MPRYRPYRVRATVFIMIARVVTILLVCNLAAWSHGLVQVKVQVCQNKDCCQRFEGKAHNLVQTVKNLVSDPEVVVESSGCLSMCGKGPNVCIRSKGAEERYYGSVADAASVGAVLELACPDISINPTLVSAINVMERAAKAISKEEKERLLTSVISALSKKDDLKDSRAMAHAHAMRADVLPAEQAVADAKQATQLDPSNDKAWRILVDACEATGNTKGAIHSLQNWSRASPTFATKALKEIQRLSGKL